MKKLMMLGWGLLMSLSSAQGSLINGWERPIYKAKMNVKEAHLGFSGVNHVTLTLTRKDDAPAAEVYTGATVEYTPQERAYHDLDSSVPRSVVLKLVVTQKEVDNCGSVYYKASLPKFAGQGDGTGYSLHSGFTLHLVDHSQRECEEGKGAYKWQARLIHDFGAGGSSDSILFLLGNPESVVTIQ